MPFEKERQFYRTQIPPGDVALFHVGALKMPIREISERGIRYDAAPGHKPEEGEQVSGIAAFKTIGEVEVTGKFVRTQGRSLVIVLDPPGIPYGTLMALQRFLMKRYPGRK
jgi:hypothetical protein